VSPSATEPALVAALGGLHQQVADLAADPALFSELSPQQRRDAHALGCRLQDRLLVVLSQLVAEMASDGADLVDEGGLPRSYGEGGSDA
jgi:hypothetical protein